MYKEKIIIREGFALQARSASELACKASKFIADVVVIKNGQRYNAKGIMGLLSMGLSKGDVLTIQADGADAYEAVKALVELICIQHFEH